MTSRYALYWAPPAEHALWRAGCEWLGRDPESGASQPARAHRTAPRRYGFHATFKPPFALRDGVTAAQLDAAVDRLASELKPFALRPLRVDVLDDFVALRPCERIEAEHPLRHVADACVERVDELRRLPDAHERQRRANLQLGADERALLDRWGYPWVFGAWRFHMTLTNRVPAGALRDDLLAEASEFFAAALCEPLRCDSLALFVEDGPDADLRLLRRVPFGS